MWGLQERDLEGVSAAVCAEGVAVAEAGVRTPRAQTLCSLSLSVQQAQLTHCESV